MEVAVEFEKRVAGTGIFGIIVYKLSYWQEACPVILLLVYKSSEVCLYCAVLSFCLAIGLKIENPRESSLNS